MGTFGEIECVALANRLFIQQISFGQCDALSGCEPRPKTEMHPSIICSYTTIPNLWYHVVDG